MKRCADQTNVELFSGKKSHASTSTVEILEHLMECAKDVSRELTAPYDTSIYYDLLEILLSERLKDRSVHIQQGVYIQIYACGHSLGNMKAQFAICRNDTRAPLVLLEIKTKKTQLKATDVESMRCYTEQLQRIGIDVPKCVVIKMTGGHVEAISMNEKGDVEELFS